MAIRKIVSRSIGVDVIAAEDLANNSVTAAEITDGAVTVNKIGSGAVVSEKISGLTGSSSGIIQADGDGTFSTTTVDLTSRVAVAGDDMTGALTITADANPILALDRGSANNTNINIDYNGTLTTQVSAANGEAQISAVGATTDLSFYTNGTKNMTINENGYINMPNQPAFSAQSSNNKNISGTSQQLVFDSADLNIGSHYSTSTGRFTAPVAGAYYFNFEGLLDTSEDDTIDMRFYKNGSQLQMSSDYAEAYTGGYRKVRMAMLVSLSANDYVDVRPQASGTYTFYGDPTSGRGHTGFKGFLVG